jgi:hypothetical protein
MQMLDRYLHAIEFWLPKHQRQDIIAEISEDLNSQIEDQQSALGRNLTESELERLLKRRGRPVLVANRYRPQQFIIGPVLFPAYVFVLKIVGLCYLLPWLVVFVIVHRVQHPGLHWGVSLLTAGAALWSAVFVVAGIVTLIFAVLEWSEIRTHMFENWSPRQLPPVRDPYRIPRSTSVTELVVHLAFILWWMAYVSSPVLLDGPVFKLSLAPVRVYFFWGYLAIALFNIALAVANLRRGYWTVLRATCRLTIDIAGGALFCWLMKAHLVAALYIANLGSTQASTLNVWMDRCLPIALIIAVIVAASDLARIVRVSRKDRFVLARDSSF